jgi:hypothetical protein
MRHKNDIALAATTARSYNRLWRAKKLPFVITEANQVHNRYIEKLANRPDPIFADSI